MYVIIMHQLTLNHDNTGYAPKEKIPYNSEGVFQMGFKKSEVGGILLNL